MASIKTSKSEVKNIDKGIEFPDIPEMTGEFATLGDIPEQFKIMFTRGAFGKAEVIENAYKDDDRFGGVFVDKFNNPIVVFNDKPFYVNKKGLSRTDFSDFVAEMLKFAGPTRLMSGIKSFGGKILYGVPLYGGTELGAEALSNFFAPETAEKNAKSLQDSVEDAAKVGALSTATDILLPPTFSLMGRAVKSGTTVGLDIAKNVFPRYKPGLDKVTGQSILKEADIVGEEVAKEEIPLTIGQRLGDKIQQGREELIRYSNAAGKRAQEIITNFDEKQLQVVRNIANGLADKFGSGSGILKSETPIQDVVEGITTIVKEGADNLKLKSQELYEKVQNSVDPTTGVSSVVVSKTTASDLSQKLIQQLDDKAVDDATLKIMPILRNAKNQILNQLPKAKTLVDIHRIQKNINLQFREAQGEQKNLIGMLKGGLDDAVFKNIDEGLLLGNEQVIKELAEATGLYKDYLTITGKIQGKDLAKRKVNSILEKLTTEGLSPQQVANSIFGHNKLNNPSEMVAVINKLEAILPASARDQVMKKLKDGILVKAFMGKDPLKNTVVTRTAIVKNYNAIFKEGKDLVNRLFTKDELNAIEVFKDKVLPTIAAEQRINPSGTSYLMSTFLADTLQGGLLLNLAGSVGKTVSAVGRMTPVLRESFKEGSEQIAEKQANEAIENFILNMEVNPWISRVTGQVVRNKLMEEKGGDVDIEELPPELRPQSALETDEDILVAEADVPKETPQQQVGDIQPTRPNINITPPTNQGTPAMVASAPVSPPSGGGIASINREQFGGLFPQDNLGQLIANRKT
tara:strand:+ start:449 stop:2851 length:2403 start_codon:yes stop_codon:yes gene_type:complete